jgi:uncharacterized protein YbjQ (UPF0145 family)
MCTLFTVLIKGLTVRKRRMIKVIIVTTDFVPGKEIKELKGFVKGATVQTKHIGKDLMAGLKTIVGGEISEYTEMMEEARQKAIGRMAEDARNQGANAIIGMRLQSSAVMQNASEIIAYGTAVFVED